MVDDIQLSVSQMNDRFSSYQKTIYLDADRQNYNALVASWNQYLAYNDQFISLSKNVDIVHGAGKSAPQVLNLLNQSYSTFNDVKKYLAAETKINQDGAAQAAQASHNSYVTGRTSSLIIMVVALLASIALAYMIVRSISKPMTLMADGAKRIASGDLTVEEFRVKNRDEIGALAKAFNQMVDSLRNVINQVKDGAENVSAASQQISAATEQMASGSMSCDFHNYLS